MADVIRPHMTSRKAEETEQKKASVDKMKGWKELNESKILWLMIVALFMLYLVSAKFAHHTIAAGFALLVALNIIGVVALEVWIGAKTGGLGNEIKETLLAILIAAVIWYGSGFLLNTSVPLDAVVSCSMVPSMARGDMLILHGGAVQAPIVEMNASDWSVARATGLLERQCGLCSDANYTWGCVGDAQGMLAQPNGIFDYGCSMCERVDAEGKKTFIPCTTSVKIYGREVELAEDGETIVYATLPTDPFARSGDIVHRARFIVDVDGKKYIFTKGDNNNLFDVQIGNAPVDPERVKGRALVRIPYIGYFKLFISGMFSNPQGCGEQFTGTEAIKISRS